MVGLKSEGQYINVHATRKYSYFIATLIHLRFLQF
jgi:hypothetical protein